MSYAGSSGSGASLNSTLIGATVGGAPMYINANEKVAVDGVQLVYSDYASDPTSTFGLGIGPVGPQAGYAPPNIGGYKNLEGVLHVEDPGPVYRGGPVLYPEIFVQSHYRGPSITINTGVGLYQSTIGLHSKADELLVGGGAGDLAIYTTYGSYVRIGQSYTGGTGQYPTLTVSSNNAAAPTAGFVGIKAKSPQAALHVGLGTDAIKTSSATAYISEQGDTALAVRDSTNHVEVSVGTSSGQPFIGTATAHDLRIYTNNTARGVLTQTGNLFIGSTSSNNYNPEVSVLGLTGFPSAALSIAGNQSTGTSSIGQLAWYNDAAGIGTRVAAIQVSRAAANNSSSMNLSTMNAGALTTALYIGATQWVGILNSTPLAALDVTGSVRISGAGNGLRVAEGTNAKMGTASLLNGATYVLTSSVTSSSRIYLTTQASSGTPGAVYATAITNGLSFTIKSTSTTDNSTVAWLLVEPS